VLVEHIAVVGAHLSGDVHAVAGCAVEPDVDLHLARAVEPRDVIVVEEPGL
jgi:hypothetical protein